jgi:hypothetical protein
MGILLVRRAIVIHRESDGRLVLEYVFSKPPAASMWCKVEAIMPK